MAAKKVAPLNARRSKLPFIQNFRRFLCCKSKLSELVALLWDCLRVSHVGEGVVGFKDGLSYRLLLSMALLPLQLLFLYRCVTAWPENLLRSIRMLLQSKYRHLASHNTLSLCPDT